MSFDRSRLRRLIEDQDLLNGMRAAFKTVQNRQEANRPELPDLEERKERLRDVKGRSVGKKELLRKAVKNLEKNGFRVIIARDKSDAIDILQAEIGDEKLIVKSKSNISKELDIVKELAQSGIEIIETDLGDRIIQLSQQRPVHPTGPAAHLTRFQISEILSEHFEREISSDPNVLVEAVRNELDVYLKKARISITGANAIVASEGSVVLVHNEGNVTRCSLVPDKHIILTSPEKVLPTLEDAMNLVKLQTYFSTGKITTAHLEIISGRSYTSDIEKQLFQGMHGPKEIVVIFIDSGRMNMGDSELLYCIGCGNCLIHCPVYDIVGPSFGSEGHMGGIGVALSSKISSIEEADYNGLFLCTACGSCKEQCPASIDIRSEVFQARSSAISANLLSEELQSVLSSISNYQNPWLQPRSQRAKWAKGLNLEEKGEIIFYPGCSQSLLHPNIAKKTVELLREAGVEPSYLAGKEICCGSIARKLGNQELFKNQVALLFKQFMEAGAKTIITSCPGCLITLNLGKEITGKQDIEIVHASEMLANLSPSGDSRAAEKIRVTYHDPCELGRGMQIYDSPRKLITAQEGIQLIEIDRTRENSACCGAGGGIRSGYPELAQVIAKKRLKMAADTGASILLTSCPWCFENLSNASDEAGIRIEDLIEFIHRLRFRSGAE